MNDKVREQIDQLLKESEGKTAKRSRVVAGRLTQRSEDSVHVAIASGIIEIPMDSIEKLQPYGESGHARIQVRDPSAIRPAGGCGPLPDPTRPPDWPYPGSGGPTLGRNPGTMSDGTYTEYCEDTPTITYGISFDATDDSICGDDLDDWN